MTTPDDRLDQLGRAPAPPPDPRFADRLEARLRSTRATTAPGRRGPAAWWRPAALAGALVAAVVVVALVGGRPDEQSRLVLTTAVSTDVVLPDGRVVAGEAGLSLPDGALVQTGDDGEAEAGGTVVPPGRSAVVVDGALELVDDRPADDSPAPTRPQPVPTTAGPPPTRPPTTTAPPSVTRPAVDPPATTTAPTVRPNPTPTAPPRTSAETTTTAPPVRLQLRAHRDGDRGPVLLEWTRYDRPDFARYVVVRVVGERSQVIAEPADPGATRTSDDPPTTDVAYRVLVLDRDGRVVGGSALVRPG